MMTPDKLFTRTRVRLQMLILGGTACLLLLINLYIRNRK